MTHSIARVSKLVRTITKAKHPKTNSLDLASAGSILGSSLPDQVLKS